MWPRRPGTKWFAQPPPRAGTLAILSCAMQLKWLPWPAAMSVSEQLGPQRQAQLASGVLDYRETGEGPALLFIHGVVSNGDLWRGGGPRLSDRYRCITPDWPLGSHTRPMPPDADLRPPRLARLIVELGSHLGLRGATIVANDYGGALTQVVLSRQPSQFARAVLTSCDTFGQLPPRIFKPLRIVGSVLPHGFERLWGRFEHPR